LNLSGRTRFSLSFLCFSLALLPRSFSLLAALPDDENGCRAEHGSRRKDSLPDFIRPVA
jgi:hypothetical protein